MTLDLKDYSSLQEELARVKRQAQEQGIRMSALMGENRALRDAISNIRVANNTDMMGGMFLSNRIELLCENAISQPLTAQCSETERLRDAVIEAARDWRDDTEEECGHHLEWQALSNALVALDAHLGDERTEERG